MRVPHPDPAITGGGTFPPRAAAMPSVTGGGFAAPMPEADRDDLARALAGERAALGRLFDRHFERIYAVALRVLGRADLAQDITQEVFLKFRRSLATLRADQELGPWLHKVTVNACRDHLRSGWWKMSRRSAPIEAASEVAAGPGSGTDPAQALDRREEARRVHAAVLSLPEDQRLSVVLHEFEGLPHDEIARLTQVSHAAARKRHSRAMRALAILLGGPESP